MTQKRHTINQIGYMRHPFLKVTLADGETFIAKPSETGRINFGSYPEMPDFAYLNTTTALCGMFIGLDCKGDELGILVEILPDGYMNEHESMRSWIRKPDWQAEIDAVLQGLPALQLHELYDIAQSVEVSYTQTVTPKDTAHFELFINLGWIGAYINTETAQITAHFHSDALRVWESKTAHYPRAIDLATYCCDVSSGWIPELPCFPGN